MKYLFFLSIFLLNISAFSQTKESFAELEEKLKNAKTKSEKALILDALSEKLTYTNTKKSREYAQKSLKYAQEAKVDSLEARAYNSIGITYDEEGNYDKALEAYQKAVIGYKKANNLYKLSLVYNNLGILNRNHGAFEKALYFYQKTLEISQKNKNKQIIGVSYQNIGYIKTQQNNPAEGVKYYDKALENLLAIKDDYSLRWVYYEMGIAQKMLKNFEQATYLYDKSLVLMKKYKDSYGENSVYLEYAGVLSKQKKDLEKALELAQKAQKYFYRNRQASSYIASTLMIGQIFTHLKRYEEAETELETAFKLSKQLNDRESIAVAVTRLSLIYIKQGKYEAGTDIMKDHKAVFEELNSVPYWGDYYKAMVSTYEAQKNYQEAFDKLKTFVVFKDSVYNIELAQEVNNLQLKQEQAEKKLLEKENQLTQELLTKENQQKELALLRVRDAQRKSALLKLENEAKESKLKQKSAENAEKEKALLLSEKEKDLAKSKQKNAELAQKRSEERRLSENSRNNLIIMATSAVILLLALFLFVVYRNYRQKQEKNQALHQKNEEIKTQNEEIKSQKEEILAQRNKLEEAYENLQELDTFKEAMTGMIVHDLKNPLNGILGMNEKDSQNLSYIKQEGQRMLNLVLNILDVQKFESTEVKLEHQEAHLYTLAQEAITQSAVFANQKNITVHNQILAEYVVNVDNEMLIRVFSNLLSNALKYSPNNAQIFFNAELKKDNVLEIEVKDEGQGIASEHIDKVFDKFAQVEAKKVGTARSTGIGLTFCKLAIEAHEGKIWLTSEKGKGTSFYFTLNLSKIEENHRLISSTPAVNTEGNSLSKEDRQNIAEIIQKLQNYEIYEVSDIKHILSMYPDSENLKKWKDNLENIILNFNEEEYQRIIKAPTT